MNRSFRQTERDLVRGMADQGGTRPGLAGHRLRKADSLGLEGGNLERGALVGVFQQDRSISFRPAEGALSTRLVVRREADVLEMAPAKEAIAKEAGWMEWSMGGRAGFMVVVLAEDLRSREDRALTSLVCRQDQAGTLHERLGL